jgi:hypothetical protein
MMCPWELQVNRKIIILALLVGLPTIAHARDVVVEDASVYKKTVQRVSAAISGFDTEYRAWIFKSTHNGLKDSKHKNRSRDNVLIVPKKPPANDMPITLIVWNHGLGGFSSKTFERVMKQFDNVWYNTDNYVLAVLIPEMPWSVNTHTPRSRQGQVWKRKGSFRGIVTEAAEILNSRWRDPSCNLNRDMEVIVVGHSAGGSAIASASMEGSICDMGDWLTGVVWSDASYDSWLEKAYRRGCLGRGYASHYIVTRRGGKPYHRAQRFKRKNKTDVGTYRFEVLPRKIYSHGKIGNEILLLLKDSLFPEGC